MKIGSGHQDTVERNPSGTASPRLIKAAQEFEAQMMKELLAPMTSQDGLAADAGDGTGETGAGGALQQFASEALAGAISRHGGLGIASRVIHELSQSGHSSLRGNLQTGDPGNFR